MRQILDVEALPKLTLSEAMGLLSGLNALGRQSAPPFGVALAADRESGPGKTLERVYITLASHPPSRMPEAVERAARVLLGSLSEHGRSAHVRLGETAVRAAPGSGPEEIATLARRLAQAASGAVSPLSASDWPDPTRDPDSFRRFVQALSGMTVEGIVLTSTVNGAEIYSARGPGGELFLAPEESGWTLIFTPRGGETPTRAWSPVPTPQALVTELNLDGLLDADPGVEPEFHHIELNSGNIERKHFSTRIGPVVIHTRLQGPQASVETVVEIKDQKRIFTLPATTHQLLGKSDRRELAALPF
jgi:hypothetical protein